MYSTCNDPSCLDIFLHSSNNYMIFHTTICKKCFVFMLLPVQKINIVNTGTLQHKLPLDHLLRLVRTDFWFFVYTPFYLPIISLQQNCFILNLSLKKNWLFISNFNRPRPFLTHYSNLKVKAMTSHIGVLFSSR